jgi:selenocysteine-specific elongation factor
MYTIGTAGHVDHGKSTLVTALTGIDPDRLSEEKERGMTIDLGFAWVKLPSGREVSIVDVPGHERFIKNMLAGVGGIDLAMLVIAADEGVMPQTREHLAILDLLRVKRGMVVLTKIDMVDADWLELVREDVSQQMNGTVLEGAPIMAVSAVTGKGLDELKKTLDSALADLPVRKDTGRPRLPVDRVFTMSGFGTVVTGTLIDGELRAGQELEVLPEGLKTRARGLQTHRHKVETVAPGNRVAVNIASLAVADLKRGDVVTIPGWLKPTKVVDVDLRLLASAPKELNHNAVVSFHTGSAETIGKIGLLDHECLRPGERGWAQIRLEHPVAMAKGDLFVIRSTETTLGGGEVVDIQPKRHRRFNSGVTQALEMLQKGSPEEVLTQALNGRVPVETKVVAQKSGLPAAQAQATLETLLANGEVLALGDWVISRVGWLALQRQVADILKPYHAQYRLRRGMPREELKSRLGLPAKLFNDIVPRLQAEGVIGDGDALLRLADHSVQFSPQQEKGVANLFEILAQNPYGPPARSELEQQCGLDAEVIEALIDQNRLVKVLDNMIFSRPAYDEMVQKIAEHIKANGKIAIGEVRDLFGTSRKYAQALMEYLDQQKITRRVGDERVLR